MLTRLWVFSRPTWQRLNCRQCQPILNRKNVRGNISQLIVVRFLKYKNYHNDGDYEICASVGVRTNVYFILVNGTVTLSTEYAFAMDTNKWSQRPLQVLFLLPCNTVMSQVLQPISVNKQFRVRHHRDRSIHIERAWSKNH